MSPPHPSSSTLVFDGPVPSSVLPAPTSGAMVASNARRADCTTPLIIRRSDTRLSGLGRFDSERPPRGRPVESNGLCAPATAPRDACTAARPLLCGRDGSAFVRLSAKVSAHESRTYSTPVAKDYTTAFIVTFGL